MTGAQPDTQTNPTASAMESPIWLRPPALPLHIREYGALARGRIYQSPLRLVTCLQRHPVTAFYPRSRLISASYHVFTEGVLVCGRYVGDQTELVDRERYNNHPAIGKNLVQVEAKFAAEDTKLSHIILPRFLTSFLPGPFISTLQWEVRKGKGPLQWEVRKGKGHICVDCTKDPSPVGAPNSSITKPSVKNADECPPVYYSDAFQGHLVRLWRMRMAKPEADILQHCDYIDSAFRRILYHPDLALVFAYVLGPFVIVPVGMVLLQPNVGYSSQCGHLMQSTQRSATSYPGGCRRCGATTNGFQRPAL
jgi:hypothetical protein